LLTQELYTSNNSYMKHLFYFLASSLLACSLSATAQHSQSMDHGKHLMLKAADLKWSDGPPSLPAGAKMSLLNGDPAKEGMFALRIQFPANYRVTPHWHPTTENVVVLEGELNMGSGEKFDEASATTLSAGDYSTIPAKSAHYVFTRTGCTLHLYAEGPFAITYFNPADDPRGAK
jgi:quercetin dioxygenase-like cupin family protein